jgi:hypothetical protein
MLACELGLAGIRPVLLDSLPGPNPQARVNRIVGQAARILDHRGLYSALSGADNRYIIGAPDADVHALIGRWVPDFAVTNDSGTRRVAELARSGRPLLLDLTDRGEVAAVVADIAHELDVVAGRPVGDAAATAILVRPDGYVAWASSATAVDPTELAELRRVLARWFGI